MEKTNNYKIVLEILGEKWKSEGRTIKSALDKVKISWEQINGKGSLTVSKGRKKHEHLMTALLIRRIFTNKVTRQVWAKNLEYLLKNDNKNNIPQE